MKESKPWFKLWASINRDSDFLMMKIGEQLCYLRLLAWASEQDPRGTFSLRDRTLVARLVIDGRTSTLNRVIDYCNTKWLNDAGEPHIVIEGDLARFRTFDERQAPPSASKEAVRERVAEHRGRRQHAPGNGFPTTFPPTEVEEFDDAREVILKSGGGRPPIGDHLVKISRAYVSDGVLILETPEANTEEGRDNMEICTPQISGQMGRLYPIEYRGVAA